MRPIFGLPELCVAKRPSLGIVLFAGTDVAVPCSSSGEVRPAVELPSIALASKALRETVALLTDDLRLARTEAGEIIDRVEGGGRMSAAAAVILIPAVVVLLFAGAAALVEKEGLSWPIATLIVGGALTVVCAVVAFLGFSRLRSSSLALNKTARQLRRDAALFAKIADVNPEQQDKYENHSRAA